MAAVAIVHASSELPSCKPSLMPFHIAYNGPAPVSQFMRVEKLRKEQTMLSLAETSANIASGGEKADKDVSMEDVEPSVKQEPLSLTAASSVSTVCDTPTTATPASELSENTLVSAASADSNTPDSVKLESQNSDDAIPALEEMDKRVVAAFRGRAIHGLDIDIPAGYSGLVLLLEPGSESTSASSSSKKPQTKTKSKTAAKVREATPEEPTTTRRRGRLTRSAALPKHVVVVEDPEEEVVDLSNDDEDTKTAEWREDQPRRNLTPISTFTSFTLWHADRPVDKHRDEYYRTLSEWIDLSHVINGCT